MNNTKERGFREEKRLRLSCSASEKETSSATSREKKGASINSIVSREKKKARNTLGKKEENNLFTNTETDVMKPTGRLNSFSGEGGVLFGEGKKGSSQGIERTNSESKKPFWNLYRLREREEKIPWGEGRISVVKLCARLRDTL